MYKLNLEGSNRNVSRCINVSRLSNKFATNIYKRL